MGNDAVVLVYVEGCLLAHVVDRIEVVQVQPPVLQHSPPRKLSATHEWHCTADVILFKSVERGDVEQWYDPARPGPSRRCILEEHDRIVVENAEALVVVREQPQFDRRRAQANILLRGPAQPSHSPFGVQGPNAR